MEDSKTKSTDTHIASSSRRSKRLRDKLQKKAISGTCNVCSAPCSSCMHSNQTGSVMESNNGDGVAEEASFTNEGIQNASKSRPKYDRKHAASETSNLLNTTLSHDSFSENAQSKSIKLKDDPSYDDVEMPFKEPLDEAIAMNNSLGKSSFYNNNENSPATNTASGLSQKIDSMQDIEQTRSEQLGDNISCISGYENQNSGTNDRSMECNKQSMSNVDSSSVSFGKSLNRLLEIQGNSGDLKDSQHGMEGTSDGICGQKNSVLNLSGDRQQVTSPDHLLKNEPSPTLQNVHSDVTGQSSKHTKDIVEASDHLNQGLSSAMDTEKGDCKREVLVAAITAEVIDDVDTKGGPSVVSSGKLTSDESKENNIASAEILRSENFEKENEKLPIMLDSAETTGPSLQTPEVAGSEHDDSDLLEDDVKVCDICGDAGREDKLAICSKCSDGAEHIYCMRIRMDEVPEGDWLCEECQLKEDADKKKLTASENLSGISKAPSFNKRSQNIGITSKVLPHSDAYGTRTVENVDASSRPIRKSTDTSGLNPSGISTSNPKSTLIRESSFKNLDVSKTKLINSGNQAATSFPSTHARSSIGSKNQARIQSPRGTLASFSGKSKIQQATEKTSQKPKLDSDSDARKDSREHGFFAKSGSFKTTSTGFSKMESVPKHQATRRVGDNDIVSSILDKQRSLLERSSGNASTSTVSACNPYGNIDKKKSPHEMIISDKGSENLRDGTNQMKQQHSLAKTSHFASNERSSVLDSKSYNVAAKEDLKSSASKTSDTWSDSSAHLGRDGRSKETLSNSRPVVPSSLRVPRCQKCNETGHTTQLCSIDMLRFAALKPSAVRNSKDMANKIIKWRDAVQAAVSKNYRVQKSRLSDQPNEMPHLVSGSGCGVSPRNHLSDPSICIGHPSASEGTSHVQDNMRSSTFSSTTFPNGMIAQKRSLEEVTCSSRGDVGDVTGVDISNCNRKLSSELVQLLANSSGALVVPELEYIWKGAFTINSAERFSSLFDVQAHLSTRASQNVLKVVENFPNKVKLVEVPCSSMWPLEFHKKSPTEENIALFFFATSTESYEKGYKKLLENMLKNDLVLTGSINGVDLLIIPSSKLPERSQRWNRLFFLWGVFRLKASSCSQSLSGFPNKLSDDKLSTEHSNQLFPRTITTPVFSEKEQPCGFRDKELAASVEHGKIEGQVGNVDELDNPNPQILIHVSTVPFTEQSNSSLADNIGWKKTIDVTRLPNEIVSMSDSHSEEMETISMTESVRLGGDITGTRSTMIGLEKSEKSLMEVAASGGLEGSKVSTKPVQANSFIHGVVSQKATKDEYALQTKTSSSNGVASAQPDFSNLEHNTKLKRSHSTIDLESIPDSASPAYLLYNEEREAKRSKPCTDKLAKDNVLDTVTPKLSSKIHPMMSTLIHEDAQRAGLVDDQKLPGCSTSSEQVFFPVSSGNVGYMPVDFIRSVVAPSVEPDVPDLELALGAEKKSKKGFFPLFLASTVPQSQEVKPPDPVDMDEDPSQSLSLSLAIPSPHEEQPAK